MLKKREWIVFIFLILAILVLVIVNLFSGSSDVSINQMLDILASHNTNDSLGVIVWQIRMPRMIESAFLGGALALSGYLLQSFFANPIAGPYVLGISSGAKLFVAILMVCSYKMMFNMSSLMMVAASFIGSCLAAMLVIVISKKVKNMAILIVCGVMIGYVCSAATELLVAFADDSNIVNLHNWSMGSFAAASWKNVEIIIPVVLIGLVMSVLLSKGTSVYLFGESYAMSVGMNIKRFRLFLILVSSLLSAIVTAYAGPISFVGIAVPHVIRTVSKTSNVKAMICLSFLGGMATCLMCDLIARCMFAPMELSVSTITAVFGAPVVVVMLLKKKNSHQRVDK
ncbi:MAG: iron ABC transporter permease [Lachnospiraceae bacterium]|nr:iron ABC transporter permease [Candidatus Merdinaster equi]